MSERGFLIEIATAPAELAGRELLELVLAAASLDVDLVVLFRNHGLAYLEARWNQGWRQLLDHELATVCCLAPAGEKTLPGLLELEQPALDRLRAERIVLEP
ncbi:MAG: hypothetical protein JJU31_00050 [Wenzhouxiangella sp.]|nr:hypothetical protein [Wenzhouxiangella sp.]MCH8479420.1 hypothetical protein [Wenzhouxiangella sp.]TVR94799.1 MAG: hypothetical protein EA418_09190 [Wenzhouxiangellaceae bacterium]